VSRNLSLIETLTDKIFVKPVLYPSAIDFEKVKAYAFREEKKMAYMTIAPTSVWFTKQLPAYQWVKLINKESTGIPVYLLGAPGDFDTCEQIIKQAANKSVVNLAGKLSFLQSAALMKNAVMNYVNDSAPLHMASALNAPVTAVFCSTIPAFGFGPLSDHANIMQIDYELPCRPCGLHGFKACPKGHFKCAEDIII
jgi:ADP-heptose:LPS heptosyltransferase